MKCLRRHGAAALFGLGLTVSFAPAAYAHNSDGVGLVLAVLAGFAIADITFATYDIAVAAKGELPDKGWATAEIAVAAPQMLLFNGVFFTLAANEDEAPTTVALFPVAGVTALTTHGIWTHSDPRVHPGALAGVSSAIGADLTLTGYALSRAARRRLGSRSMGIAEMVLTVPQVIVGSYELGAGDSSRGGWIALTAWSGTLLLHGLASTIWGRGGRDDEVPPEPPPPPPIQEKPPLLVPASIHVAPTLISDGFARVPGLAVGGAF